MATDNDKNNPELEPIEGQPGWYWDHKTGRTVREEELGGHLEKGLELDDDADDEYQPFDDEGEEYFGEDPETQDPSSSSSPNRRSKETEADTEAPRDNPAGGQQTPENIPGTDGAPSSKNPTDILNALPTDKMGETGEKIEKAKDLARDVEDLGKLLATEGADLEAWGDLALRHKDEIKKGIQMQVIGWLIAIFIVFGVPVVIVSLAFMGYGTETASGLTTGGTGNGETVPRGKGYTLQNNTDYSATLCALGSTDSGIYTHPTEGFTIRLCGTPVGKVASINSQSVINLLAAAKLEGLTLGGGSFRSYEEQIALRKKNCPNWQTSKSTDCNPPTATAGNSMHEKGLATDFNNSRTRATNVYVWLSNNAARFGYYNYAPEPWHWSTSGG